MKQQLIVALILILTTPVFGQSKDRRAVLDIQGRVREISVSPNEKIWLVTALGNIYYTNHIDSNWHFGNPSVESKALFDIDSFKLIEKQGIDRISFFNKDTAIMTGYISANNEESKKNGYYFTKDAGKNWELMDFGGDSWIYTVYTDKQGNAWMGGLSKKIYYSNDFGQSWKTRKLPLRKSERIYSIYMIDSKNGIVGSDNSEILITTNNWKRTKRISTPFDQIRGKYRKKGIRYSVEEIAKIQIWNHYIVVNQSRNVFYSDINNIDWKHFPIKILDFELDKESNTLFAIDDSLRIVSFTTPNEYHLVTTERLLTLPTDMKVVNGSLFILLNEYLSDDYEICKVNKNGLIRSIPYTTEKKIEEPHIVKQGTKLVWGTNGKHIYLADKHERDWYRENTLDFRIGDLKLLNDSVAILWDGEKNNYIYSLNDHTAKEYFPQTPLQSFLASPIKKVIITSGFYGCYGKSIDEVRYEKVNDSILETKVAFIHQNREKKSFNFQNTISLSALTKVLTDINSNPSQIPTFEEFYITDSDKKNYLIMVDNQLKSMGKYYSGKMRTIFKDFYHTVPAMLDTLDNSVIATIINQSDDLISSTTKNRFIIQIINQNKDTINISRLYYAETLPWNLPWEFEFNGQHFNCYSIDFSRLVNSSIPNDFNDKEVFSNSLLIMKIADYLWNKEE